MRRSVRSPKARNALSNALRRIAGNLRAAGIEIQFGRSDGRGRHVVSLVLPSFGKYRQSSSVTVSEKADLLSTY